MSSSILTSRRRLRPSSGPSSLLLPSRRQLCYWCHHGAYFQGLRIKQRREEHSVFLSLGSAGQLEEVTAGSPALGLDILLPELITIVSSPVFSDYVSFCIRRRYWWTRDQQTIELKDLPQYLYSAFHVWNYVRNSGKVIHGRSIL